MIRKRTPFQWLAGIATVCFLAEAQAVDANRIMSQFVREQWSTESSFSGSPVRAITQTPDGYLWIGTQKGLVRFDGFDFHPVPSPNPAFQNDPILALTVDANGRLCALFFGAGVLCYSNGKLESLASATGGTAVQLSAAWREKDGTMLLADETTGILRVRGKNVEVLAPPSVLPGSALILAITETGDGKIWLGTVSQGLFYVVNGRATQVVAGLPDEKINCVLPVGDKELWVGTDTGLFRGNASGFGKVTLADSVGDAQILTLLQDRKANIWVGTSRGLSRFDSGGVSFSDDNDFRNVIVNTLFEDLEGNLWAGGAGGVERIKESTFVTYSLTGDSSSKHNGPVYVDPANRVFLAATEGGMYLVQGERVRELKSALLQKEVIYSITGRKDEIWVGSRHSGLIRFEYKNGIQDIQTYTQANGLAENSVYSVYQSQDGTVWAGTLTGGVSKLKDGRFTTYTTTDGLAANAVSSILGTRDGTIWFATSNGLSSLSGTHWKTYTVRDDLPSDSVNCLLEDSSGVLWIGTSEGLAFFKSGRVQVPRGVADTFREEIFGIAEDGKGRLWIATSNHILRVPSDKLSTGDSSSADIREYGSGDGLRDTHGVKRSMSVVRDSEGKIWLSMSRGLSVVDPSHISENAAPALVHVENILADNVSVTMETQVRISPARRRITFAYTGLSLAAPERVRFRYLLEPFDRGWSAPVAAREAVYTNLSPGSYRFRLIASNSDGVWNPSETSVAFEIEPALWQTWWFRSLCVIVFLALFWAFYRWRVHRLKSQEGRLREVVETIPAMTFTALYDGFCTFVNKRWTEYTGLSVEETSGIGWQRAVHPEDLARHSEKWRISVATGQLFEDEARFRRAADEGYRWFLVRGVPLRDQHGKIAKWYGTLTDIEDRKRAEQERVKLRQLEDDLAHINRVSTLGEMAASLAHEIKQHIAATITSANSCMEWLGHEPPNLDRARAAVARIDKYGNRAAEIIDRIRSLYRKSPSQRELVDVNGIIQEMLTLLKCEADRYSIAMRTELATELPKILADRVQLQQVLMNLTLNAIEAMQDSGGQLTVRSQCQDSQLLFSVSDTGVGLPTEKMEQIFSAFFTTKPQGSGMGLAISRSIIESHGGRLWATPNDGRGASFHFTLQCQPTEPKPSVVRSDLVS